jgi:AraC-like DNA-binding protein
VGSLLRRGGREDARDRRPRTTLDLFESIVAARLPRIRGLQPEIAEALGRFAIGGGSGGVGRIVEDSGYSHRRFIALFRRAVGLTPKVFWRVRRFQRAIARLAAASDTSLAELALDEGYSDQSHFNREFREFTGLTPRQYREIAPASGNHVPMVPRRPR